MSHYFILSNQSDKFSWPYQKKVLKNWNVWFLIVLSFHLTHTECFTWLHRLIWLFFFAFLPQPFEILMHIIFVTCIILQKSHDVLARLYCFVCRKEGSKLHPAHDAMRMHFCAFLAFNPNELTNKKLISKMHVYMWFPSPSKGRFYVGAPVVMCLIVVMCGKGKKKCWQ